MEMIIVSELVIEIETYKEKRDKKYILHTITIITIKTLITVKIYYQ